MCIRDRFIHSILNAKPAALLYANKTELIIKLMIEAAIFEFMFMHKNPVKVIISEYIKVADFFVENTQKSFLNAILDKVAQVSRIDSK